MEWWIVVVALAAVAVVVLVLLPLRIQLRLQGRGDPSGEWALAGALKTGPLLVTGVAARGVPARAEAALFGRTVWSAKPSEDEPETEEPESELERAQRGLSSARDRYRRVERWLSPEDMLAFALRERRRIELEGVEADLDYSFEDVILTGKLLGAVYALNGALPDHVLIRQTVSWESVDRAEFAATGKIRVWPGLLLVDTVVFVVRHLKLRRRPNAARGASQAS